MPEISHPHHSRYPQMQRPRDRASVQGGLAPAPGRKVTMCLGCICVSVMPLMDPRVKMVLFVDFLQPLVTASSLSPSLPLPQGLQSHLQSG